MKSQSRDLPNCRAYIPKCVDYIAGYVFMSVIHVSLFNGFPFIAEFCMQEKRRLYDDVFGSLKPVSDEEYTTIYESTGLDIDGRLERIEQIIPLIEVGIRNYIAFVKRIPGFRDLPADDQVALFKRKFSFLIECLFLITFPAHFKTMVCSRAVLTDILKVILGIAFCD